MLHSPSAKHDLSRWRWFVMWCSNISGHWERKMKSHWIKSFRWYVKWCIVADNEAYCKHQTIFHSWEKKSWSWQHKKRSLYYGFELFGNNPVTREFLLGPTLQKVRKVCIWYTFQIGNLINIPSFRVWSFYAHDALLEKCRQNSFSFGYFAWDASYDKKYYTRDL